MKKTIVVLSTLLHGCASMSNYTPIVDTFGDSRVQYISADMQECKQLAQQASVASEFRGVIEQWRTSCSPCT